MRYRFLLQTIRFSDSIEYFHFLPEPHTYDIHILYSNLSLSQCVSWCCCYIYFLLRLVPIAMLFYCNSGKQILYFFIQFIVQLNVSLCLRFTRECFCLIFFAHTKTFCALFLYVFIFIVIIMFLRRFFR